MVTRYQKGSSKASGPVEAGAALSALAVREALEHLVKRGAQEMLRRASESGLTAIGL